MVDSGQRVAVGDPVGALASPYQRMKNAILVGDLIPGEALVETVLAKGYGVSRTPIREALTRLEQDGLVERRERGLVVRERSPEEILDIYESRIVLEATAAKVAASRRSTLDIVTLHRIAHSLEDVDASDDMAMAAANRRFHQAIWYASHNQSLEDLLGRLDHHLARYPATTLSQPGRWEEGNREHWEILRAIEAGERDKAHDLTAAHFQKARDLRLSIWAQGLPESFDQRSIEAR